MVSLNFSQILVLQQEKTEGTPFTSQEEDSILARTRSQLGSWTSVGTCNEKTFLPKCINFSTKMYLMIVELGSSSANPSHES